MYLVYYIKQYSFILIHIKSIYGINYSIVLFHEFNLNVMLSISEE